MAAPATSNPVPLFPAALQDYVEGNFDKVSEYIRNANVFMKKVIKMENEKCESPRAYRTHSPIRVDVLHNNTLNTFETMKERHTPPSLALIFLLSATALYHFSPVSPYFSPSFLFDRP